MSKRILLVIAIMLLSPGYAMGQDFTNQSIVNLEITGDDNGSAMGEGAEMQFSNDGIVWSDPEPFSLSREGWVLTPGDGPKVVLMRLKDPVGNWSQPIGPAEIVKDTGPPDGTVKVSEDSVSFTKDGP